MTAVGKGLIMVSWAELYNLPELSEQKLERWMYMGACKEAVTIMMLIAERGEGLYLEFPQTHLGLSHLCSPWRGPIWIYKIRSLGPKPHMGHFSFCIYLHLHIGMGSSFRKQFFNRPSCQSEGTSPGEGFGLSSQTCCKGMASLTLRTF